MKYLILSLLLLLSIKVSAQVVTVTVEDFYPVVIEKVNMKIRLAYASYPEETSNSHSLFFERRQSKEALMVFFKKYNLNHQLVDTEIDTIQGAKEIAGIVTKQTFELSAIPQNKMEELVSYFLTAFNIKIIESDFFIANEADLREQFYEKMMNLARVQADEVAQAIGRKVTTVEEVELVQNYTKAFFLEKVEYDFDNHKLQMKLAVSFETEGL